MNEQRVDAVDAVLPQTQCARCGYPDCRTYAAAITAGDAPINRCPPGGQAGVQRLARLLGTEELSLDPAFGREGPRVTAVINEAYCIGCTLCIEACPVDAIVGRAKRMHTVLTAVCNGCELCLPPCPVDCIDVIPLTTLANEGNADAARMLARAPEEMAPDWRQRYRTRTARRARLAAHQRRGVHAANTGEGIAKAKSGASANARKAATVAAALERARARRLERAQDVARTSTPVRHNDD